MTGKVDRDEDGFTVDAAVIAEGLELEPSEVPGLLRSGAIASACERGSGEDRGRHRLTFSSECRRLRLVVDDEGRILSRSATAIDARARSTGT